MSRKLVLSALIVAAVLISAIPAALGWTVQDCIEVNYDHPDCDQYPTTTLNDPCDEYHETRHPECQTTTTSSTTTQPTTTTTEGEVTTTTGQTTTTTPNFDTTPQTTTTVAQCAPGLIHVPPLCLAPGTPEPQLDPAVPVVTTPAADVLPFTGDWTQLLALIGGSAGVTGAYMIRRAKDKA